MSLGCRVMERVSLGWGVLDVMGGRGVSVERGRSD